MDFKRTIERASHNSYIVCHLLLLTMRLPKTVTCFLLGLVMLSSAFIADRLDWQRIEKELKENKVTKVTVDDFSVHVTASENTEKTILRDQMITKRLGEWFASQKGSDFSFLESFTTEKIDTLTFPSSTHLIVKPKGNTKAIWIVENSLHQPQKRNEQLQLLRDHSKGENSNAWLIQPIQLMRSPDQDNDSFCRGMAMTMSMGGFQSSLTGKGKADCLNYFLPKWKLDSLGKFQGAMVYSFLMGLLVEGITSFQIWIRPHLGKGRPRKIIMSILYSMQQWLGYLVMMITMMYSIELFASLLVGLVVGRVLFLPRSTTAPKINTTRTTTASSSENNGSNTSAEETPLLERHPSIRRRRR